MSGTTIYKITDDILALSNLLDGIVDEEGYPRTPTEDEMRTLEEWFTMNMEAFQGKVDNICRFIRNQNAQAANCKAEYDTFKGELDRLSKRKTAAENRAKTVKNLLWFCMQRLNLKDYKTDFFSLREQNTAKSIKLAADFDGRKIPDEYLKPREIDTTAIKDALKSGALYQKEGDPLQTGKLFYKDADGTEKKLEGVYALAGKTLMMR